VTTDSYTTNGTYTWTCPAGVTTVTTLEILGSSASGAAPGTNTGQSGGGGGGGAYGKWSAITVVPGTGYTVVVAAGGAAAHGGTGHAGAQSSMVIAANTYLAAGGAAGLSGTVGAGGAGGAGGAAPTNNSPTSAFAGGNGAAGTPTTGPAGGGGGAATSGGAGGNASGGTAGSGGGNGGTTGSINGVAGTAGAGGGGQFVTVGTTPFSGAGTDGFVKITYTLPAGGLTFRQAGTAASGSGSVAVTLASSTLANSLLVAGVASQGGSFTAPAGWSRIQAQQAGGAGQIAVNIGARITNQTLGYPSTEGDGAYSAASWTWAQGYLGNINATKAFYTTTLPTTFTGSKCAGLPAGVVPVICYKTQTTNVASFVTSVNRPIVLVYHQEPEGDYTLGSTFVAEFKGQSNLIRAQGNSNVQVACNSAGYPYRAKGTADVLAGNYLRGLGPYVDLFLKDIYQDQSFDWSATGLAGYDQFQNWLTLVTNTSIVGTEQPLGIAEYGIGQTGGNAVRAARIATDAAYLSGAFLNSTSFPLQFWMYWWDDNAMTSASDQVHQYQFTDTATCNQWASYTATGVSGNSELWYYPSCPSGITSITFTTTAGQEARGSVIEVTSDPSTTQVLNAQGNAAAGAVTSLPITTAPSAASGDFGVASWMNAYPSAVNGSTWGTPPGMTPGAQVQANVVNLWNGYQPQLPTATWSKTQTYSDGTMNGWAATAATFTQVTGTALAVTTASLPAGLVGVTYAATLAASGGQLPYTWAVTAGSLPAGLSLNASTGRISGTPTTVSAPSFTVRVTDGASSTATASLSITVTAGLAISTSSTLPSGTVGVAYTTSLTAVGGVPPYTWAVLASTLPPGLALSAAGVISGTPTQPVNGAFTVGVADSAGATTSAPMFLSVTTTAAAITAGSPTVYSNWPDLRTQLGLVLTVPVQPAGTFLLDDTFFGLLDTNVLGSSEQWTDVSNFTRSGTVTRPSSRLQGPLFNYQTGTMSVNVKNDTGNFDPDNAGGPWYGQLNSMIPVRQFAVWRNVTYPLFYGFADGFTDDGTNYANRYCEVVIPATDGLKILQGITLATLGAAAGGGETTGARITRILNAAGWYTGGGYRTISTGDSTVQGTTFGDTALNLMQVTADSEIGELYIDGDGKIVFRHRQGIITDTRSTTVQAIFGDAPYQPIALVTPNSDFEPGGAFTWTAAGNSSIARTASAFHNGAQSLAVTSLASGAMQAASCAAASVTTVGLPVRPNTAVTVGAWFLTAASARSVNAGLDFYDGSGTFISTLRGANVTDSTSAWTQATAAVTAPAGAMFCRVNLQILAAGGVGEVHYADDVTITSLPELPCTTFPRARDDTTLANDIQATSQGGTLQEAKDAGSIQQYRFPRTYARSDLILQDDLVTLNWAQYVLSSSKTDEDRFDQITINPLRDPENLWPQVLGRRIGDRIQIWRRPPGVAAPVVKDVFIRGISHTWGVSPLAWTTTWQLQNAARAAAFFVLDDPILGRLDYNSLTF
jgi:hypothetical protein